MQRSTIVVAVVIVLVAFLLYRNKTKSSPGGKKWTIYGTCLLYTSPSPRDKRQSRMPSSA